MALFVITVFIIILRRIMSLVSIIIFNIIPGLFGVILLVLLLDGVCLGAIRCDWRGGES